MSNLDKVIGGMKYDKLTGLALPEGVFTDRALKWITELVEELDRLKIPHRLVEEEAGIAMRRDVPSRQWLVFSCVETRIMPVSVYMQMVRQWLSGHFGPDNVYKLLTPEEQIRVSNRTGRKPLKDAQDPQKSLNNALKLREDIRRQGFDPQKEGLS